MTGLSGILDFRCVIPLYGGIPLPRLLVSQRNSKEIPVHRRLHIGEDGRIDPRRHTRALFVYLIPMVWPDIVTTASGPSVFHADFLPVTAAKPARAGETLILTISGLGPTRPGLTFIVGREVRIRFSRGV